MSDFQQALTSFAKSPAIDVLRKILTMAERAGSGGTDTGKTKNDHRIAGNLPKPSVHDTQKSEKALTEQTQNGQKNVGDSDTAQTKHQEGNNDRIEAAQQRYENAMEQSILNTLKNQTMNCFLNDKMKMAENMVRQSSQTQEALSHMAASTMKSSKNALDKLRETDR